MKQGKLQQETIDKNDIEEYLKNNSDFSFEITVLKKLLDCGYRCTHSGSYIDPITLKTREYDIRAIKYIQTEAEYRVRLCLAVECKNIGTFNPIVIHRILRDKSECYQYIAVSNHFIIGTNSFKLHYSYLPYKEGDYVGKAIEQIGRKDKNKGITSSNSNVFERYNQAIHSTYDLILDSYRISFNKKPITFSIILPMLVIPDNVLWCIDYNSNGDRISEPEKIPFCDVYIDKKWEFQSNSEFRISHLSIVQRSSIEEYLISIFEKANYDYDYLSEEETVAQRNYLDERNTSLSTF